MALIKKVSFYWLGWILLFIYVFFLASCTPQQRLNRMIARHPELAQQQVVDRQISITGKDTVVVPDECIDTVFNFRTDTIFKAQEGRVTLDIARKGELVRIITRVRADTIIKPVTLTTIIHDTTNVFTVHPITGQEKAHFIGIGMGLMLLILVILLAIYLGVRLYLKTQIPIA